MSLSEIEILLLAAIGVFILYLAYERYRLRHYYIKTGDLPDGMVVSSFCKGDQLYHIVSDGEGYSRPLKAMNKGACFNGTLK